MARRLSVRARTTLIATSVVALALIATSFLLVGQVRRNLVADLDRTLRDQLGQVAAQLQRVEPGSILLRPGETATVQVTAPDGRLLAESAPVPAAAPAPAPASAEQTRPALVSVPRVQALGDSRRMVAKVSTPRGPVVVSATSATESVRNATGAAIRGLLLAMPILLALVAVVTWFATGLALRPVEAIRREFAEITAHDLHRRVPAPASRDEVARLARTMNRTLDRLDASVTAHRRFIADASHELRSPLATMRTPLEVARLHPDRADWPSVADGALQDVTRLEALAADLLLLARLDAAPDLRTRPVDVADLVRAELDRRTDPHPTTSDLRPVRVHADRARLVRLLANLLDNAHRHADSAVHVAVRREGPDAVLEVSDDGDGIPPAERERVFERFTRLDDARSRDSGGTGLGLPIAREIAKVHGGTLHAGDRGGGARLVLRLPTS